MTDYSTTSYTTTSTAGAGAAFMIWMVFYFAFIIFVIAGLWKTFTKAGKPGWAAIVPIYNIIVMLEVINRPLWWIILLFIPFVNIIISIIMMLDLAKAYGKGIAFAIFGLIIFSPIGLLMLGFGSAKYLGVPKRA